MVSLCTYKYRGTEVLKFIALGVHRLTIDTIDSYYR